MEGIEVMRTHSAMGDGSVSWSSETGEFVQPTVLGAEEF